MVGRGEVTDRAWARIEPLLPAHGRRGGRWRDHRQVLNAILWKLRTGAPWRDLPERYGPWKTAHERLRRWTADGTWERILAEVIVKDDAVGEVEWVISVDSSSVRATSTPLGPGKGGCTDPVDALAVDGEALGRSRGGLTSKLHLAVDAAGLPVAVTLTPGQAGDNPQLLGLIDTLADLTINGRRVRVGRVLADKAYSTLHPPGAAPPQDQDHHPRTQRPDRGPPTQRPARRTALRL